MTTMIHAAGSFFVSSSFLFLGGADPPQKHNPCTYPARHRCSVVKPGLCAFSRWVRCALFAVDDVPVERVLVKPKEVREDREDREEREER